MTSLSSMTERYSQEQNKTFLSDCNTLFSELFPNEKLENAPVNAYEWRKVFFERRETLKEILMEQTGGLVEILTENPQAFYESFGTYLKIKKGVKFVSLVEQLIPQDKEEHKEKVLEQIIAEVKSKVAKEIVSRAGVDEFIDSKRQEIAQKRLEPEALISLLEKTHKVEGETKRKVLFDFLSASRDNWDKIELIVNFFSGVDEKTFQAYISYQDQDSIEESEGVTVKTHQVTNLFDILCEPNVEKMKTLFGKLKPEYLAHMIGTFPQEKRITLKKLFAYAETQRLIQILEEVPYINVYSFLVDVSDVRVFTHFLEITQLKKVIGLLSAYIESGSNLQSLLSDFRNGLDVNKFAEFVNTHELEVILECFQSFRHPGILFGLINSGLFASFLFLTSEKNSIKDVYEKLFQFSGDAEEKVQMFQMLLTNVGHEKVKSIFADGNMKNFAHFMVITNDRLKINTLVNGIEVGNFLSMINLGDDALRSRIYGLALETPSEQFISFINSCDIRMIMKLMKNLPAPYSVDLFIQTAIKGKTEYSDFLFKADEELLKTIFEGGESSERLHRLKNLLDGKEVKRNLLYMNKGAYSVQEIISIMKQG